MIGFWTPAFATAKKYAGLLGDGLYEGAPKWLKPHLKFVGDTETITLMGEEDLGEISCPVGKDIAFRLHEGMALVCRINVPEAIKNDLKNAVRLEAARLMPVDTATLCLAIGEMTRTDEGQLIVEVVALRKSLIGKLMSVGERLGSPVQSITVVNTLTSDVRAKFYTPQIKFRQATKLTITGILFLSIFGAVKMLPGLYIDRLNSEILGIEKDIRRQRQQTGNISSLQKQVEALRSLADAVNVERDKGAIVALVAALTEAGPDEVYLEELSLNGDKLYLKGRAASPEDWAIRLTQVPGFADVTLSSVLGSSTDVAGRFEIRLGLDWHSLQETSGE